MWSTAALPVERSVLSCDKGHLARGPCICESGNRNPTRRKEPFMFEVLTEEMLDLSATVRGYGAAVYAIVDDGSCGSCGLCCSVVLCCSCSVLCF